MLASERHAIILDQIQRKTTVSTRSLIEHLGVTRETVRKDIEYLAERVKLRQIRGGATQLRTQEIPMASRTHINASGKTRIALALAAQIPDGSSLFLDNGSSTFALAQALHARKGLMVYTNDFAIAQQVAPNCRELIMLGGKVDTQEMATIGIETTEQIGQYHVDFAVISAGGLSARTLLTDFSKEAVSFRTQMLLNGSTRFVIADHAKFGVVGQMAMPTPPKGTCIIMDQRPDPEVLSAITQNGMTFQITD